MARWVATSEAEQAVSIVRAGPSIRSDGWEGGSERHIVICSTLDGHVKNGTRIILR